MDADYDTLDKEQVWCTRFTDRTHLSQRIGFPIGSLAWTSEAESLHVSQHETDCQGGGGGDGGSNQRPSPGHFVGDLGTPGGSLCLRYGKLCQTCPTYKCKCGRCEAVGQEKCYSAGALEQQGQ